jgi:hypothetical protein
MMAKFPHTTHSGANSLASTILPPSQIQIAPPTSHLPLVDSVWRSQDPLSFEPMHEVEAKEALSSLAAEADHRPFADRGAFLGGDSSDSDVFLPRGQTPQPVPAPVSAASVTLYSFSRESPPTPPGTVARAKPAAGVLDNFGAKAREERNEVGSLRPASGVSELEACAFSAYASQVPIFDIFESMRMNLFSITTQLKALRGWRWVVRVRGAKRLHLENLARLRSLQAVYLIWKHAAASRLVERAHTHAALEQWASHVARKAFGAWRAYVRDQRTRHMAACLFRLNHLFALWYDATRGAGILRAVRTWQLRRVGLPAVATWRLQAAGRVAARQRAHTSRLTRGLRAWRRFLALRLATRACHAVYATRVCALAFSTWRLHRTLRAHEARANDHARLALLRATLRRWQDERVRVRRWRLLDFYARSAALSRGVRTWRQTVGQRADRRHEARAAAIGLSHLRARLALRMWRSHVEARHAAARQLWTWRLSSAVRRWRVAGQARRVARAEATRLRDTSTAHRRRGVLQSWRQCAAQARRARTARTLAGQTRRRTCLLAAVHAWRCAWQRAKRARLQATALAHRAALRRVGVAFATWRAVQDTQRATHTVVTAALARGRLRDSFRMWLHTCRLETHARNSAASFHHASTRPRLLRLAIERWRRVARTRTRLVDAREAIKARVAESALRGTLRAWQRLAAHVAAVRATLAVVSFATRRAAVHRWLEVVRPDIAHARAQRTTTLTLRFKRWKRLRQEAKRRRALSVAAVDRATRHLLTATWGRWRAARQRIRTLQLQATACYAALLQRRKVALWREWRQQGAVRVARVARAAELGAAKLSGKLRAAFVEWARETTAGRAARRSAFIRSVRALHEVAARRRCAHHALLTAAAHARSITRRRAIRRLLEHAHTRGQLRTTAAAQQAASARVLTAAAWTVWVEQRRRALEATLREGALHRTATRHWLTRVGGPLLARWRARARALRDQRALNSAAVSLWQRHVCRHFWLVWRDAWPAQRVANGQRARAENHRRVCMQRGAFAEWQRFVALSRHERALTTWVVATWQRPQQRRALNQWRWVVVFTRTQRLAGARARHVAERLSAAWRVAWLRACLNALQTAALATRDALAAREPVAATFNTQRIARLRAQTWRAWRMALVVNGTWRRLALRAGVRRWLRVREEEKARRVVVNARRRRRAQAEVSNSFGKFGGKFGELRRGLRNICKFGGLN